MTKKKKIDLKHANGFPTYLIFKVHVYKNFDKNTGQYEDNIDLSILADNENDALAIAKNIVKRSKEYTYRVFAVFQDYKRKEWREDKD